VRAPGHFRRRRNHRLSAAIAVDDREAPVDERNINDRAIRAPGTIAKPPAPIRPAMGNVRIEQIKPLVRNRHPKRQRIVAA